MSEIYGLSNTMNQLPLNSKIYKLPVPKLISKVQKNETNLHFENKNMKSKESDTHLKIHKMIIS